MFTFFDKQKNKENETPMNSSKKSIPQKTAGFKFTDVNGKEWFPKITLRVVRNFEQLTGIGLFQAVFESLEQLTKTDTVQNGMLSLEQTNSLCKSIFGHVGNMGALLYEACVPITDKERISLDDFLENIQQEQVTSAMICAFGALIEFFPVPSEEEQKETETRRAKNGNPTLGRMSANWPQ